MKAERSEADQNRTVEQPELNQRFALAMRAARMGSWSWRVDTGRLDWDRHTSELFGLPPEAGEGTLEEWEARLHPDDREWVAAAVLRAVEERHEFRFDHRCIWPDGEVHWLEC